MKKIITSIVCLFIIAGTTNAQLIKSNPFKPVAKPDKLGLFSATAAKSEIQALRFTPMAGYNLSTKQIQAGIGYGLQFMHFVDSTQKYYTDFSVQLVGWVNGSTTPSLNPPNFVSGGITVGFLNQKVQVGAAYTPKTSATKANVGLIVNFAVPLNN